MLGLILFLHCIVVWCLLMQYPFFEYQQKLLLLVWLELLTQQISFVIYIAMWNNLCMPKIFSYNVIRFSGNIIKWTWESKYVYPFSNGVIKHHNVSKARAIVPSIQCMHVHFDGGCWYRTDCSWAHEQKWYYKKIWVWSLGQFCTIGCARHINIFSRWSWPCSVINTKRTSSQHIPHDCRLSEVTCFVFLRNRWEVLLLLW